MIQRLLEVAERRGLLLLHLTRSLGSLTRARQGRGRRATRILQTADVAELWRSRTEEVMGILARRLLLRLVGLRWVVGGCVLRKGRGWLVRRIVRRREGSSDGGNAVGEAGMAVRAGHC